MSESEPIPKPRFTGIFIPVEILELKEISLLEKILLSWIDALYDEEKGGCYASNFHLSQRLGVKENTIVKAISKLRKMKLIEDVSFDGRKRVIISCVIKHIEKIRKDKKKSIESQSGSDKNPMLGVKKITPRVGQKSHPHNKEKNPTHTNYSKEESKVKNIAQSRKNSTEQRPDFYYCFEEKKFVGIEKKDLQDWRIAFSFIKIEVEILKSEQWIQANPSKSKKKLWRKFLLSWFSRANDKAENKAAYNSGKGNNFDRRENSSLRNWEKEMPEEDWTPPCPFEALGIDK